MISLHKRFFKEYLIKFKFKYVFSFILTLLQNMITICIPLIYTVIIDKALPNKNEKLFFVFVGLMVISYIGNQVLEICKEFIVSSISEGVTFKLRDELNSKIPKLSNEYFSNNSFSEILSRYEKEISIIKNNSGHIIIEFVSNMSKLILIVGIMLFINIKITLFSIAIILIYLVNYKFWSKRIKIISEKNMKINSKVIEKFTENYNNALVTKLYSAYGYSKKSFIDQYEKFYKNCIKFKVECSLNIATSSIILFISMGVLWLIGGYSVIEGTMTIGMITAMINYQSMLLSPIRFFSEFNNSYQSAIIALDRLYKIFDYREDKLGNVCLHEEIENITFKDVCFSYNEESNILKNINMNMFKNEVTSIVGLSGSGKSTIVKLILGLHKVNSGDLYLNDININSLDVTFIRDKISLISQDTLFFRDTIIENLKLSKFKDEEKLIEISKKLDIYEDIKSMPLQWDTLLSPGTINLSGGQKKRLDILRALLKESEVIIFDESTASLDEIRRENLFDLIKEIKKDKIIIVISHNLKELRNSDKIYVFEDGSVVDIESIDMDTKYSNMIKMELEYA